MTFFEENRQFSGLIRYYANKLNDPHAEGELWGFLWIVKHLTKEEKTHNYYAVCLRNEYIRLSKEKAKYCDFDLIQAPAFDDFSALELDLKKVLTHKQFELCEALQKGYLFSDYARAKHCSRATVSQMKKGIAKRLSQVI